MTDIRDRIEGLRDRIRQHDYFYYVLSQPRISDKEYDDLMKKKEKMPKTKFGDAYDPKHVESLNKLSKANLA